MLCLIRVCLVIHRSSVIELAQQMGSTVLDFSAVGDPAGIGRLASGAGGEKIGALSAVRELWYGTFRLNFHRFDRFELDLRGHIHVGGAALSCLRLKWADMVLI